MNSNSLASTSLSSAPGPRANAAKKRALAFHEDTGRYVVTLSLAGDPRSQIWDSSSPLPLGDPYRWVLERVGGGIRVRELPVSTNQVVALKSVLIEGKALENGESIQLPSGLRLSVKPMRGFAPVFTDSSKAEGALRAYACVGDWVLQATPVGDRFVGYSGGEAVFSLIRQNGSSYRIEGAKAGLVTGAANDSLSARDLASLTFRFGAQSWRFDLRPIAALTAADLAASDPDAAGFAWMLRSAMVGLASFMILAWLWPKPAPENLELIPEQYAKIVLAPKPVEKKAAPMASSGATAQAATSKSVPKSVQKAAVVQAFRARALQNAVSGLLKGGMTSLLAQSDFVAGRNGVSGAKRILDARSDALRATAPDVGGAGRKVAVAAVGGGAQGGSGLAQGVGYGKGEKAGVTGQGKSLVSLDTPAADVQEGLTKDEVGEVIHRHLSEVRYCYESAMIRQPDIEGKLLVSFVIGGSGGVKTAEVRQSTLPDPRLDDCIIRRLVTWKFPQTKGGIDVAVTYPFIFKTLGR